MATLGATASTATFPATAADVGAEASGAVATHAAAADPHTGYLKETDFDDIDFLVGTATGHTGAEIVVPAVGLALLDDTTVGAQRATLDLDRVVPVKPPFRTALYYASYDGAFGNVALVQSTQYATPFYIPTTVTADRIGYLCTGVASSSANLAIYNDTAGVPDTLLLDCGNVTTTSTAFSEKTINQSLVRGWYWLACAIQGATGQAFCNTSSNVASSRLPLAAPFSSFMNAGYAVTGVTGTPPSPWGATKTETARVPVMFLRFSAV